MDIRPELVVWMSLNSRTPDGKYHLIHFLQKDLLLSQKLLNFNVNPFLGEPKETDPRGVLGLNKDAGVSVVAISVYRSSSPESHILLDRSILSPPFERCITSETKPLVSLSLVDQSTEAQ
ncbi:hypothetical protein PABG_11461 [Paracoccidioides brasiliensis Pb03]|nr:hypothetical protein PABG_11461 [Paracoccidioides brasiliensis Pb03]